MNNVLVVLNYNDAKTSLSFVEMAIKCTALDKIILVDNCSSDDSYEQFQNLISEKIDVIKTEKNGGYAYGNNFGCKYAIERYNPGIIFISNPDVRFENNVLNEMEKVLCANEHIGVIAPVVNQGYNVWNLPGYIGLIESIFLVWFNIDKSRIKKRLENSSYSLQNVGVVEGSFFAISACAFKSIEGLDERTFLYCEEIILANKLREKGYKEAVLTHCRYDHFHSVSIKKQYGNKTRAFKNFHSSMLVYLNNYLKVGIIRKGIFEICFCIGYLERMIYDICIRQITRTKRKIMPPESRWHA